MTLPLKQIRIYVVDDEYQIASSLALVLRFQGFVATFFTEPLLALEAARDEAPDLVISDVAMGFVSGIELAVEIGKRCPNCKVLLVSGQPDTADMIKRSEAQGHTFPVLPKPLHPTELLMEIRGLFGLRPH